MSDDQRKRLNQVLDYGGQLISLPLIAYGLWSFNEGQVSAYRPHERDHFEHLREVGLWFAVCGLTIWGGTRAALYVLDGQNLVITKRTAQRRALAVLTSWWTWGSLATLAILFVVAVFATENPEQARQLAVGLATSSGHILGMVMVGGLVAWLLGRKPR